MSDDIKKLVARLRATFFGERDFSLHDVRDAANALEALAAECDLARSSMRSAVAERDRLKDEVEHLRNEKVAGVAALKAAGAGLSPASGQAPATDPAPAVCEWTRTPWGPSPSSSPLDALYIPRCNADYLCSVPDSGICRRCGLPVKFKEAKE